MKTELLNFNVPESLIAQSPSKKRSDSRLLVYNRITDKIIDSYTKNFVTFLNDEHFLIFNNSRVIPARMMINKKDNNRSGEILILKIIDPYQAEVLTDRAKKYSVGTILIFPDKNECYIKEDIDHGIKILCSDHPMFTIEYIEKYGHVPLPPYIKKKNPDKKDKERYQTVFSKYYGSAAAPTAGLHFDKRIFKTLDDNNIKYAFISLHVGLGTFQPIYAPNIEDHKIHKEEYYIEKKEANKINKAISDNKKIIPVGTTSLRTLETAFNNGKIQYGAGLSNLYIHPPYHFKIINGLITNFHTPKSSLAVLVSSLIGVDKLLEIYHYAIKKEYRFFSYGDAMLII